MWHALPSFDPWPSSSGRARAAALLARMSLADSLPVIRGDEVQTCRTIRRVSG